MGPDNVMGEGELHRDGGAEALHRANIFFNHFSNFWFYVNFWEYFSKTFDKFYADWKQKF